LAGTVIRRNPLRNTGIPVPQELIPVKMAKHRIPATPYKRTELKNSRKKIILRNPEESCLFLDPTNEFLSYSKMQPSRR
jgi:hypothetical protein